MSDCYGVALKKRLHQMLLQNPNFSSNEEMLEDMLLLERFANEFE